MTKHGVALQAAEPSADQGQAPQTYEVNESLPIALVQAREAVMYRFRPILRRFHLTDLQWRVLLAVRSSGEVEVARLAQMSCLLAPSLSRVLKDMSARGLLNRRAPASDQRRSLISLSPEGERLMGEVFPQVLTAYAAVKERYGAEKLVALREMLFELGEVLGSRR